MGDNRIFNVNGEGDEMLLDTLKLIFKQEGDNTTAKGWRKSLKHGLILYAYENGDINLFPNPLTAEEVFPIVKKYLKSGEDVELDDWDKDADHDGSNGQGWRVYCEDWGHIGSDHSAFAAIKPVYIWYGK